MTYDDGIQWLQGWFGSEVAGEIGAAEQDPEGLAFFSGRLTRATDNPIGRGGDLVPPDPSLWFEIEPKAGSPATVVLAPYYVDGVNVADDGRELRLKCGPYHAFDSLP